MPALLGTIEQADRALLYRALGLRVVYRRVGEIEQVRLRTCVNGVDLERVGKSDLPLNALVEASQGVDLERVGGPTRTLAPRPVATDSGWSELRKVA